MLGTSSPYQSARQEGIPRHMNIFLTANMKTFEDRHILADRIDNYLRAEGDTH